MASGSTTKPRRYKVDYDNVILALPSVFPPPPKKKRPRAPGGRKGATASQKTTTGKRKNRKAAPRDELTKGQKKNHKAATRDAVTIGCSSDVATNRVNDEHLIQEEYTGTMEKQNSGNNEDILGDSTGLSKAPSIVDNEQRVPKVQSGDPAGLLLLANAGEDILTGNPAEEPNAGNNEQHSLDEQAGIIVEQQNHANAQENNQAEADPVVMDDIFEFPLKNQLLEDLDYHLKDLE